MRSAPLSIPRTSDNVRAPDCSSVSPDLMGVSPSKAIHWASDSSTKSCCRCSAKFGWIVRKHHCRMCGRIFCDDCSNKRRVIPEFIRQLPRKPTTKFAGLWSPDNSGGEKRVCIDCYDKLDSITRMWNLIQKFESSPPKIAEIPEYITGSRFKRKCADHCMANFADSCRSLNYSLTPFQVNMLEHNIDALSGHSHWIKTALIHKFDEKLLATHERKHSCKELHCPPGCTEELTLAQYVEIYTEISKSDRAKFAPYFVKKLQETDMVDHYVWIPTIVQSIEYDKAPSENPVWRVILACCAKSNIYCAHVHSSCTWFRPKLINSMTFPFIERYTASLGLIESIYVTVQKSGKMPASLSTVNWENFVLPIDPCAKITGIAPTFKVMASESKPVKLTFQSK